MEKKSRRKTMKKADTRGGTNLFHILMRKKTNYVVLGSLIIGESVFIHDFNIQDYSL
jgi:hypothetical protein